MQEGLYSSGIIRHALQRHVVVKIVNLFLGFAFQILVVKILKPHDFAAYSVLLAFLMTAQVVALFGVERTILRFVPHLTMKREFNTLWRLVAKLATLRLTATIVFILVLVASRYYIFSLLRIGPEKAMLITIALWFIALTIAADAEALAQSWMMHFGSALIATLEIFARFAVTMFFYVHYGTVNLEAIVAISAATAMVAAILLILRLLVFASRLPSRALAEAIVESRTELDLGQVPTYAMASYFSSLGWVINGPLVIRIVGSTGLGVTALGAFSFVQGLLLSVTRALPGMLILPALEPVLMAELSSGGLSPRIIGALSLAMKLEFLAIFALLILTTVAGPDILRLLAKPEYMQYYFIMPLVLIYFMLSIAYRVLEVIVRMVFRHHLFVMLWPLGVISLVFIYATARQWGVWSVLIWPIAEMVLRIGALLIICRIEGARGTLDAARSLALTACAGGIISVLLFIQHCLGPERLTTTTNYSLALIGMLLLGLTLFLVKPLRPVECEHLLRMLPVSWTFVPNLLLPITRA